MIDFWHDSEGVRYCKKKAFSILFSPWCLVDINMTSWQASYHKSGTDLVHSEVISEEIWQLMRRNSKQSAIRSIHF